MKILGYMLKLPGNIQDLIDYYRAFSRREYADIKVIKVDDDSYLLAAKKLHAKVYLARGFVSKEDVVNDILGSHIDPYQPHSQYFAVINRKSGSLIATSRQIQAKRHSGHYSFAMFKHAHLYDRARKLITDQSPLDCVEISGLAKQLGASKLAPLLLYRAMWHHSLRLGHKMWLLVVDVNVYKRLKLLFGSALSKAGPATYYLGSNVVPAILNTQSSVQSLEKSLRSTDFIKRQLRLRVVRFVLKGIPEDSLNEAEKDSLHRIESLYSKSHSTGLRQRLRLTAIVGLVGYTILRFFLVSGVFTSYNIDPWFFLFLDVITVIPYVLGIEYLIVALSKDGADWRGTLLWGLVAAVSFAAPYVYIFVGSNQLPTGLGVGLGLVIALLAMNVVRNVAKRIAKKKQL